MPTRISSLFIAADDLFNYRDFVQSSGKWGHAPFGVTLNLPNLKRLEARSTSFRRAACNMPVCSPSRGNVMTGYSVFETGLMTNEHFTKYIRPEQLWTYKIRKAGYFMGTVGKIFHGYTPQPDGVYQALYDTPPFNLPWNPSTGRVVWSGRGGEGYTGNEDQYYDSACAKTFSDWLPNAPADGNWHYEVGFHHPHTPWTNPNRCFEAIDINQIVIPVDWPLAWDLFPFAKELETGTPWNTDSPGAWTAAEIAQWRGTVRNYLASILWLDECLGMVLDALEASPFNATTIICFWSDHGYHLGDKGRWHKFTLWEEAANAPMMISAPGQTEGADVWTPVALCDMGATICDYLGVELDAEFRGVSLRPLIEGGTMPERMIPTFAFGSASGAIGDYRITLYQDGSVEYYNVLTDPWLKNNLGASGPNYAARLEMLIETAREWGLDVVQQGAILKGGTPFAAYLGYEPQPGKVSSNLFVIGDVDVTARSPGYQIMYATTHTLWPADRKNLRMPADVKDLIATFRMSGAVIYGNTLNNDIKLNTGIDRTVHMGDGDDFLNASEGGRVVAYGGRGNDTIVGGDNSSVVNMSDTIFGGAGNDSILAGGGNDYIDGGTGDDWIEGGTGNDKLIGGPGNDTLLGGEGDDLIVVSGSDVVRGQGGANTFRIYKSGGVPVIRDLTAQDTIDLSHWSGIQPVTVTQVGSGVEVTAAMERVIFDATTVATVRARITGATLA